MKALLRSLLIRCLRILQIPPAERRMLDAEAEVRALHRVLAAMPVEQRAGFARFSSVASELIEARLMGGSGPRANSPAPELVAEADAAIQRVNQRALGLREGGTTLAGQGAFGDIELALANVEWRREINLSWLEFSRWGIQQIILISRLYYIKNPLLRRAVDVCAAYVFGRGVEITSTDPKANDTLQEFFERNRKVFGPNALIEAERSKYYDGNLFWVFFPDLENSGQVDCRMMDATEVQEIINDPDDADRPILYKRMWRTQSFDANTGKTNIEQAVRWYPALGFDGAKISKPAKIGDAVVEWDKPVYHRKCGNVAKWNFGCPVCYPAIEWAKTSKEFLEACLTLAQSHAQLAWTVMSKGGQAALEGIKAQLGTTVNAAPSNSLWDNNPTPNDASIFAAGPGTTIAPVQSRGKGLDPTEVKEFRNMVGMVFGIPPTWLGDMETANLSTATTLDRPTELGFRAKQVQWEEDFVLIAKYVLEVSAGATKGKLREARGAGKVICITEGPKRTLRDGRRVYDLEAAAKPGDDKIEIRVTFPSIREGDTPAMVLAISNAMTLQNKGGQIIGIDEKEGVRLLFEQFGVENAEDLLELMYPSKDEGKEETPDFNPKYDPSRTRAPLPAPLGRALPNPGGEPQLPGGVQPQQTTATPPPAGVPEAPTAQREAFARLVEALKRLGKAS